MQKIMRQTTSYEATFERHFLKDLVHLGAKPNFYTVLKSYQNKMASFSSYQKVF